MRTALPWHPLASLAQLRSRNPRSVAPCRLETLQRGYLCTPRAANSAQWPYLSSDDCSEIDAHDKRQCRAESTRRSRRGAAIRVPADIALVRSVCEKYASCATRLSLRATVEMSRCNSARHSKSRVFSTAGSRLTKRGIGVRSSRSTKWPPTSPACFTRGVVVLVEGAARGGAGDAPKNPPLRPEDFALLLDGFCTGGRARCVSVWPAFAFPFSSGDGVTTGGGVGAPSEDDSATTEGFAGAAPRTDVCCISSSSLDPSMSSSAVSPIPSDTASHAQSERRAAAPKPRGRVWGPLVPQSPRQAPAVVAPSR
eukprot:scaffold3697_cov390-Prasinococcus_capsulatus_cf.AAC.16